MGIVKAIGNVVAPTKEREEFPAYSLPLAIRERVAAKEEEKVKGFSELAGLDELIKQRLYSWRFELRNPGRVPMQFKAILFSGPTGVGKTALVEALIKEAGEYAVKFDPDKVGVEDGLDMTQPDVLFTAISHQATKMKNEDHEKNRRSSNNRSRRLIVFLNEVDRYFPKRTGEGETTSKSLAFWDDIEKYDNVWVVGMTNHTEFMSDAAFSRFKNNRVEVQKPDRAQLIDLFAYYIAFIDHEAQKQGRDLFEEDIISLVDTYRKVEAEYEEYLRNNPKSKPDTDSTLKRKISELGDAAEPLSKLLGSVLREAKGLAQRDVAGIMEELAQAHHVELSRKEVFDEYGMDTSDVVKISLSDIENACSERKMQNAKHDAKVRKSQERRGR